MGKNYFRKNTFLVFGADDTKIDRATVFKKVKSIEIIVPDFSIVYQ
jgi:hypothetical protein